MFLFRSFLLMVMASLVAPRAVANSCPPPPTVLDLVRSSDAIVLARTASVTEIPQPRDPVPYGRPEKYLRDDLVVDSVLLGEIGGKQFSMQYWTGCEAWLPAVGEQKVIFVRGDPNGGEGRRYRMRSPSWWGPEADYLSALKVLFPLRDVPDLPKAKAALERRMKRGAFPEGVTRALSRMLLER